MTAALDRSQTEDIALAEIAKGIFSEFRTLVRLGDLSVAAAAPVLFQPNDTSGWFRSTSGEPACGAAGFAHRILGRLVG